MTMPYPLNVRVLEPFFSASSLPFLKPGANVENSHVAEFAEGSCSCG